MKNSKSVLAIDDSRTMRGMLDAALRSAGLNVVLAKDGVDGLEKLHETHPSAVITDINMPRLDGFGVIDGIRSEPRYARIPVLVLTTESGGELKSRAKCAGATGWIVKPFDRDKLISVLSRLIA